MAEVEFVLGFLPPESSGQIPVFQPGASIAGTIQVTPQETLNCRHLLARLRWYTEGRGDMDKQVLEGWISTRESCGEAYPSTPGSNSGCRCSPGAIRGTT